MTAYLAVAKYRKPHGLKGEVVVIPLTDDPEDVFVVGRRLRPIGEDGEPRGEGWVVSRSRPFHRQWLLQFEGVTDRAEPEGWPQMFLGAPVDELKEPEEGQMYVHEIPGSDVVVAGEIVGRAGELISAPGGDLLTVLVNGREVLVPFREPILKDVNRAERRIELDPPPGLLEL